MGKTKLRYLRESVDYAALPPELRFLSESIMASIDDFTAETDYKATLMQKRVGELQRRVIEAEKRGIFRATNGGAAAFLSTSCEKPNYVDCSASE